MSQDNSRPRRGELARMPVVEERVGGRTRPVTTSAPLRTLQDAWEALQRQEDGEGDE